MATHVIVTDRTFDKAQTAALGSLAELMIPAEGELPSAADPAILAEIVDRLNGSADIVKQGLACFDSALPPAARLAAVDRLRDQCPAFVALFEAAVAACYYRDERVLRSLGLPSGAPYPQGNTVAPTDWSLLRSVRERQPFYRRA